MKFDKEHWKELGINVDSLWLIGPRAKGGKRANVYHGNFTPQIPEQMIRRYTETGDIILEPFAGSGTTLYEAESLHRRYIGMDINEAILKYVEGQMVGSNMEYYLHNADATDSWIFSYLVDMDLKVMGARTVDLVMLHPPYLDIVKFTDKKEDLSAISDIDRFTEMFIRVVANCYKYLKTNKYIVLVIGDVYKDGEVIPLGFHLMNAVKQNFPCKLKGIVVKDMVGNRAKLGIENLWRYRALRSDNFLFKHEYLFVFKKTSK